MNKNEKATFSIKSKLPSNIASIRAFENLKSFEIMVDDLFQYFTREIIGTSLHFLNNMAKVGLIN